MAANEDIERKAMMGELDALHAAWHDAEEIAAIADELFADGRARRVQAAVLRSDRGCRGIVVERLASASDEVDAETAERRAQSR